jgi:hypothetical protein
MKFPVAIALLLLAIQSGVAQPAEILTQGTTIELNGRKATLTRLDTLLYVESEYTKRFKFDSYHNPKLKELREHYRLAEVIASGRAKTSSASRFS